MTPEPTAPPPDPVQQPHAFAAAMRAAGPVQPMTMPDGPRFWLVTGYEESKSLLTDPRLSSEGVYDRLERRRIGEAESTFSQDVARNLLNMDPPDHTRLRKLVTQAFTRHSIAPMRPRIERIADELLDAIPPGQTVDLLPAYAYPLPVRVTSELLGLPAQDTDRFLEWSSLLVSTSTPEQMGETSREVAAYLSELVESKRRAPQDDLLSELIAASEDGDRLNTSELIAMAVVLLIGGYETTVNLISSGVKALLDHPDQMELLRRDPELLPDAVEEFLRYETPNNLASPRYTTAPVRIAGVEIPEGEFVMVSLMAANRDGAHFGAPDRLDITRRTRAHLGFGHGIHYCVGAPLARLEGEVAFGRLLQRFSRIEPAVDPAELRWRPSTSMHGLDALPLRMN